jgi:hypothetical protein
MWQIKAKKKAANGQYSMTAGKQLIDFRQLNTFGRKQLK